MKILVTGGGGYVGSTLVPRLLGEGHDVRVLDALLFGSRPLDAVRAHPRFELIQGDVADAQTVRQAAASRDAVVHLAAVVGDPACARQPDRARAVNLGASLALLEECRGAGVKRLVFASTCSNYGKMKNDDAYVDESSELAPVSLYAETKVAVEKALLEPRADNGLCTTVLRFATVYGVSPRMRFDLTVNEFTMELLTKGHLQVFGEQFWRPYIHVGDAARAIALVLTSDPAAIRREVFNVGSTQENYRKVQIVELAKREAPTARVEYVHRDEDPRDYRVSFAKVASRLAFSITRTVPDGIREVAELVRSGAIRDFGRPEFRN